MNHTPLDVQSLIKGYFSTMGKKGGKIAGAKNKAKGSEYFSKISRDYWDRKRRDK